MKDFREYPVIKAQDPDYDGHWSIYTNTGGIDAELCGKIADERVADYLIELWEENINRLSKRVRI